MRRPGPLACDFPLTRFQGQPRRESGTRGLLLSGPGPLPLACRIIFGRALRRGSVRLLTALTGVDPVVFTRGKDCQPLQQESITCNSSLFLTFR